MPNLRETHEAAFKRLFLFDRFFEEDAERLSAQNWKTMRPMSLLYLGFLAAYLVFALTINPTPLHLQVVAAAIVAQLAFIVWTFAHGSHVPNGSVVAASLAIFGAEILALAAVLGTVVFPHDAALLFPLALVLMTQIYTLPPRRCAVLVVLATVVFLVLSAVLKGGLLFVWDCVSTIVALGIAGSSYIVLTDYKVSAWEMKNDLENMCALDQMTGVLNKETFEYRAQVFLRARNKNDEIALAVIDLDEFKSVNDGHGHLAGDRVLRAFAHALHSTFPQDDPSYVVGRIGGDEFAVLAKAVKSHSDLDAKLASIEQVRGFEFPVSCSIGVAYTCESRIDYVTLFGRADANMYHAKSTGFHAVCPGE